MSNKRWVVSEYNKDFVLKAAEEFHLPPLAVLLLSARGVEDFSYVQRFLLGEQEDPTEETFADMDQAVERIRRAIDSGEKIAVFGDYDADGVTATALLYSYLDIRGADVQYYIPDRQKDGYGLNCQSLSRLKEQGVQLVITVDNGISALEEADFAKKLGLDVVITDHHLPGEKLPDALAVVDPHREDCPSRFKDYAGVGVAFQLICAVEGENQEELLYEFGDLVALGTIADIVPLVGANRELCKYGLDRINHFSRAGIESLKLMSGMAEREIDSLDVSYYMAPRINAAGRMGNAAVAVELLLKEDISETDQLIDYIQSANTSRKEQEEKIQKEAVAQIRENPSLLHQPILVVSGSGWHPGVIGIVAARLVNQFEKPCFVLTIEDGIAKGSGRSVGDFDLYEALSSTSKLLEQYGGHTNAAGITLQEENLSAWTAAINAYAKTVEIPPPILHLDAKIGPSRLNLQTVEDLELLKPYGCKNEEPLFGVYGVRIVNLVEIGGGKHVKLTLTDGKTTFQAVCFGKNATAFEYHPGDTVDVAVQISKNLYGERVYLSVVIKDIRLSGCDIDGLFAGIRLYNKYCRGDALLPEELRKIIPTRQDCASVYRFLKSIGEWDFSYNMLYYRFQNPEIGYCKMRVILDVFQELQVVELEDKFSSVRIVLPDRPFKANLNDSSILKRLRKLAT